jgi:hypothetical protein
MKSYGKQELGDCSVKLRRFADVAATQGRPDASDVLTLGADVCADAAVQIGTARLVYTHAAEELDVKVNNRFFDGAEPVQFTGREDCCPFTHEGICKGCGFNKVPAFVIFGKAFTCLSRWANRKVS